jgi:hypothetical protein
MKLDARRWGTFPGLAASFMIAGAGCESRDAHSDSVPPLAATYFVTIEANTVAGLGACPQAGAVGLVTTTTDGGTSYTLYRCGGAGGAWTAIQCNTVESGSVAYVPDAPNQLFACADQTWNMVPLPVGPQGPPGPQGEAGPTGPKGNSITVTQEPAGTNCATGGLKLEIVDANGNPVGSPQYVCNGGQCTPGQPGFCDLQVAYSSCQSNGRWITVDCASQDQTCIAGACQGNCAQGDMEYCNGQVAYSNCSLSGWRTSTDCARQNQTCDLGGCIGSCAQGEAGFCNGQVANTGCNPNGEWNTVDCAAQGQTCISAVCGGECTAGATRYCDSGVYACTGVQTCQANGYWESQCHATNCQPFPLGPPPDSDSFGCGNDIPPFCFGDSCNYTYTFTCPAGTVPTGQCDTNCGNGCCVNATSGKGCDWGITATSASGPNGSCTLHMGVDACNGLGMWLTPWCVGIPN